MSWILGSTTLPEPKGFSRRFVEKAVYHEMINGTSKKDVTSRKEAFSLAWTRLPQATVANILAEYGLRETLTFSVDDGELSIAECEVHVDISGRDYKTKGGEFREDIEMLLTQVNSSF